MPPCNCGGAGSFKYEFTDPNTGRTTTFSTEIEAKAAKVRNNNQGTIRAVPK